MAVSWRSSRALTQAWQSLMASKLRTLLAIIGISIGCASVVALLMCGYLAQQAAMRSLGKLGVGYLVYLLMGRTLKQLKMP